MRALAVLSMVLGFVPALADAQRREAPVALAPVPAPQSDAETSPRPRPPSPTPTDSLPPPWWTPLASALVPGGGQVVLDQDRSIVYAAVEGYFLFRYVADLAEAQRQRNSYQDLANRVARAPFSAVRPVGNWEYYERMEHFVESGIFDLVAGDEALQPETDTTTYNGHLWLLARRTYWARPDTPPDTGSTAYRTALRFYEQRAVRPEFRWSWRDARLEQEIFRRIISRSNDAFKRAGMDLAVILANHVLSTVDAFATMRLRVRSEASGRRVDVGASLPWPLTWRRAP